MVELASYEEIGYDPVIELEGEYVAVAKLALDRFEKEYKKKWDLSKYALGFQTYSIAGQKVHGVSFLPNPVGLPSDGVLDIAQGGVWANGPGLSYFYAANSLEFVRKIGMR